MSNREKKYNLCPMCGDVELVRVPKTKHCWRCPACGFAVDPNWKYGRFNLIDRVKTEPIDVWAREVT